MFEKVLAVVVSIVTVAVVTYAGVCTFSRVQQTYHARGAIVTRQKDKERQTQLQLQDATRQNELEKQHRTEKRRRFEQLPQQRAALAQRRREDRSRRECNTRLQLMGYAFRCDSYGWMYVEGKVKNISDLTIPCVVMDLTLYDNTGRVIEIQAALVTPLSAMGSGESRSFWTMFCNEPDNFLSAPYATYGIRLSPVALSKPDTSGGGVCETL